MAKVHRRAIDFLLAAMSGEVGEDGMLHQFNASGDRTSIAGIYVTAFFSLKKLITTALFVREHGAPFLRDLPISEIRKLLTDFAINNYPAYASNIPLGRFSGSYAERVRDEEKDELASRLACSEIFAPERACTLFPLVTIRVESDFSSESFFLRKPETLPEEFDSTERRHLRPDTFPPIAGWKYRTETPSAWLGVRSPSLTSSKKLARTILGATALTQSNIYRRMFSGRTMWGGHCVAEGGWPLSFGAGITPPLAQDIIIFVADHEWLATLARLLKSEARSDRRLLTALQYFYRAWAPSPSERFPILCMALDATYGEAAHATAAVLDGITSTLGPLDTKRLRSLMDIRASVIHGGAPDVYDSRKYGRYYRTYGEDPIADMDVIVAACLRQKIFKGALVEHAEPFQDIISEQQRAGSIPLKRASPSILNRPDDKGQIG